MSCLLAYIRQKQCRCATRSFPNAHLHVQLLGRTICARAAAVVARRA